MNLTRPPAFLCEIMSVRFPASEGQRRSLVVFASNAKPSQTIPSCVVLRDVYAQVIWVFRMYRVEKVF